MHSLKLIFSMSSLFLVLGCTTVVDTNQSMGVPIPKISTPELQANIEVGEAIQGSGCAKDFFLIFRSGDNHFLERYGTGSDLAVARAKAAAAHKALTKGKGLTTDILIGPVWEISETNAVIQKDVCVKVVGFRGVIKSFQRASGPAQPQKPTLSNASEGFLGWSGND
jgi:hypothetical protein